nr:putative entry exclusion protein TrbK-alt [Mesorhizobium sp. B2-4-6]
MFARLAAVIFVAAALAAALIAMKSAHQHSEPLALRDHSIAPGDPLAAELLRCSQIGEAGPRDPGCLRAWAETRRRFLRQRAPAATPAPARPATLFPNVPAPEDPDGKGGNDKGINAPFTLRAPSGLEVR